MEDILSSTLTFFTESRCGAGATSDTWKIAKPGISSNLIYSFEMCLRLRITANLVQC